MDLPQMEIDVRVDDLSGPEIQDLIREHLSSMNAQSPPESVHALGIEKLRDPSITMYAAWVGGVLAGCGALKVIGPRDGEVKSMRTRGVFRGRGVGGAVLRSIIAEAQARRYANLWLETGSTSDFAVAHRLYERFGFRACGPFGEYRLDPFSRYMKLDLAASPCE